MKPFSYVTARFKTAEEAFTAKMAEAKTSVEAANARHHRYFIFESLMRTAEAGRLRMPERHVAPACEDCGGESVVVERNEDRAAMGIYEKIETIHYDVCFACCVAHELIGSMTDQSGHHWGGRHRPR